LQLANAYTQELIRQTEYDNPDAILSILESETHPKRKGIETFIFDDQKRTLTATFVTHSVINGDEDIIYRLLYKVKLSPVQATIK
jgi:hypothetical protein